VEHRELPLISVVVPVLNAEETLAGCLTSMLNASYPDDRREILVVDNGSTDRTPEIIARHPVVQLHEPRRGSAYARNRGVLESSGEVVAFTDADCLATTGWLNALGKRFRDPGVGGVAGEILAYPPATAPERHAARIGHLSPRRYMSRPIFPFAVTANLAFRRDVFDRIGLFDGDSPHGGESTDICTRFFRGTGYRLELEPRALVLHRHRSTVAGFVKQQWGYGRGHAFLYLKYRDELPWGWRQTSGVYLDLAREVGRLGATAGRFAAGRETRDELSFQSLEVLRKLALRLGFAHEALAHRRLLL
jgi:glycosyltransferase involved in cell wall biosynthesis